jgi:hypothetical protein
VNTKQTETAAAVETTTTAEQTKAPFFARKLGRPTLEVRTGVRAGVANMEQANKRA